MDKFKRQYERARAKLLADRQVCPGNREIFRQFFEWEEYKLKRQNNLRDLDEPCYKTLYLYITRLRIVNRWFDNQPWPELTEADIKHVYDGVEDGKIRTRSGKAFKGAQTYYSRILKGKPFELAGKAELAEKVITFPKREKLIVQFVTEEGFEQLVSVLNQPRHLLLFWLAWDVGENIGTLLQLQKKDLKRSVDPETNEPEYLVTLSPSKLKRTRQARTEPTLYPETVRFCDMVLRDLEEEDEVFPFEHRQALKLIHNAAKKTGVTCEPNGEPVRWKDLRSGMACHLLSKGWQPHEVNLRLGHTANAPSLNHYINHLAINRRHSKKRLHDSQMAELQEELRKARERERLSRHRGEVATEQLVGENDSLRHELARTKERVEELAGMVRMVLQRLAEPA